MLVFTTTTLEAHNEFKLALAVKSLSATDFSMTMVSWELWMESISQTKNLHHHHLP